MQNLQLKGRSEYKQGTVNISVPVMLFEEDKTWYAYLPSLDLIGYGKDTEEAKASLKIVLDEFIRYTLNKKTFFKELRRLGWRVRSKTKPIEAPKMSELIEVNEQLKDIIDTKQYSTSKYSMNIPAFA